MDEELSNKLVGDYPAIFKHHHYIGCGDGWYTILDRMCSIITNHIRQNRENIEYAKKNGHTPAKEIEQVYAAQIKEKFGGLRFYYDGGNDFIHGVVAMAEGMSYHTCEVCGNHGTPRTKNWISVLCDTHAAERNK